MKKVSCTCSLEVILAGDEQLYQEEIEKRGTKPTEMKTIYI